METEYCTSPFHINVLTIFVYYFLLQNYLTPKNFVLFLPNESKQRVAHGW